MAKSNGEAIHTSTFLGHPIACAAAIASIDVIVGQKLARRADHVGAFLLEQLNILAEKYPTKIAEVRGRGLMIGMEMYSAELARSAMLASLQQGLIVLLAGDDGNVVELTPPLIITEQQLTWLVATLDSVVAAV